MFVVVVSVTHASVSVAVDDVLADAPSELMLVNCKRDLFIECIEGGQKRASLGPKLVLILLLDLSKERVDVLQLLNANNADVDDVDLLRGGDTSNEYAISGEVD